MRSIFLQLLVVFGCVVDYVVCDVGCCVLCDGSCVLCVYFVGLVSCVRILGGGSCVLYLTQEYLLV